VRIGPLSFGNSSTTNFNGINVTNTLELGTGGPYQMRFQPYDLGYTVTNPASGNNLISFNLDGDAFSVLGGLEVDGTLNAKGGIQVGTVGANSSINSVGDNEVNLANVNQRFSYAWFGQTGLFSGRLSLTNKPGEGNPYIEWRSTNGNAYTRLQRTNSVERTNNFYMAFDAPASGQVENYHSVTYDASATAHIVKTNGITFLKASATLDFASTSSGAVADLPITVTGASDGDVVQLGVQSTSVGPVIGSYMAWASNGVVYVRWTPTAATQNPNSATFKVVVMKF